MMLLFSDKTGAEWKDSEYHWILSTNSGITWQTFTGK
jgi:hypothetical protein